MNLEEQKLSSLIKFYYKNSTPIVLKLKNKNSVLIKGTIVSKNFIGQRSIIIENPIKGKIKIFLDEIEVSSIIPLEYYKKPVQREDSRSPINPKLRYKILKRDRFTCMRCGARAPDVELEVDHKIPVSRGGTDDEKNLITTCLKCNRGKGTNNKNFLNERSAIISNMSEVRSMQTLNENTNKGGLMGLFNRKR